MLPEFKNICFDMMVLGGEFMVNHLLLTLGKALVPLGLSFLLCEMGASISCAPGNNTPQT